MASQPSPGGDPNFFWDYWTGEFFFLADHQFSVIATLNILDPIHGRTTYGPYGRAEYRSFIDLDWDGLDNVAHVDGVIVLSDGEQIGDLGFVADADLDRSGTIDVFDRIVMWNANQQQPPLPGRVTTPDSNM